MMTMDKAPLVVKAAVANAQQSTSALRRTPIRLRSRNISIRC
jgi:hypothetical protein